jgi:hypothetical protein
VSATPAYITSNAFIAFPLALKFTYTSDEVEYYAATEPPCVLVLITQTDPSNPIEISVAPTDSEELV